MKLNLKEFHSNIRKEYRYIWLYMAAKIDNPEMISLDCEDSYKEIFSEEEMKLNNVDPTIENCSKYVDELVVRHRELLKELYGD